MQSEEPPSAQGDDTLAQSVSAAATFDMLKDVETRLVDRRHPLRFVWWMDAQERFSIEAGDFTALAGAPTAAMLGCPWNDLANTLDLDPEGRVTRALASRDTWSGIGIEWPAEATTERLPVVLSGLPVLERDRSFSGYRGFGVCRDVAQIAAVIAARRAVAPSERPAQTPPAVAAETPPVADTAMSQPAAVEGGSAPHAVEFASAEPGSGEAALIPPGTRPRLTIVPAAKNVVPLRANTADKRPLLSTVERNAFQEIARALGARLEGDETAPSPPMPLQEPGPEAELAPPPDSTNANATQDLAAALRSQIAADERADGGPDQRAGAQSEPLPTTQDKDPPGLHEVAPSHQPPAGETALSDAQPGSPSAHGAALTGAERAVLDRLPVGVLVYRGDAVILANRALLEWTGFTSLEALSAAGGLGALFPAPAPTRVAETDAKPQPLAIRTATGEALAVETRLFTLGLEDGTALMLMFTRPAADSRHQRAHDERVEARRNAEEAWSVSNFLARISHEVRTPLNAIIGFAEIMMEQRLGPVENERYRAYLKDIHTSGAQVLSSLNDLLDLSKIEAGAFDLAFVAVGLNDVVQQCVTMMQPEANRARIIMRSALAETLPPVLADARSVQQIVLNLLSSSIKLTGAGGQVIVSTTLTDAGAAVMRVRDTGVGMGEQDVATVLEPFRPVSPSGGLGTGLGLSLSKALAVANGATFHITSGVNAGTLVEIVFPVTRVLAE